MAGIKPPSLHFTDCITKEIHEKFPEKSRPVHAGLNRKMTCANGTECDHWIVGDKSPSLKMYPKKSDEKGYDYN